MNNRKWAFRALWFIVITSFVLPGIVQACSIVCVQDSSSTILGYNFDWYKEARGLVFINERDIPKTAFMPWNDTPASWTSKYGSITFSCLSKDMPISGMNEAGLVVAQAWQSDAEYPEIDNRPAMSEVQWIQYQLDNFETVEEVIAGDTSIHYILWSLTNPVMWPSSNSVTANSNATMVLNYPCP